MPLEQGGTVMTNQAEFNPRRLGVVAIKTLGWAIVGIVTMAMLMIVWQGCWGWLTREPYRETAAHRAANDIDRIAPLVPEHANAMWHVTNEWTQRLRDASLDVTVADITYDVRIAVVGTEHRVSYKKAADLYGETLLESRDKEEAGLAVYAAAKAGRLR
jgi:hypothetical protein